MDIVKILARNLNIREKQVENTIELLEEFTVPFIARYRKEQTGNLDDEVLREFENQYNYLVNLKSRQEEVIRLIDEQGKLTEEIKENILKADTIQRIDDIYRPFRPKRRTRGTIAREKGLEGLAQLILKEEEWEKIQEEAENYLSEEKEVETIEEAIAGALDIIAEDISDEAKYRAMIKKIGEKEGLIRSEKTKDGEDPVYQMYYEYSEPIKTIANHRILAINRGEKEKVLRVSIDLPDEKIIERIKADLVEKHNQTSEQILLSIEDSYKRLIHPSIEREIRSNLTDRAEDDAIKVFGKNLDPLLMQAPVKAVRVLALDPGFRTGCKLAVIDEYGNLLDYGTIFPTEPRNEVEKSQKILSDHIEKHRVDLIAIGNGTASRETEAVVADLLAKLDRNLAYTIVNEAGASIYSASKLGQEEFPDLDVSIRGAISIGRRIQDPLSELVKIEPKHIGVGQYQHDLNQKKLDEELEKVVEDAVNRVGVDLNTASVSLLKYVAGVSNRVGKNIVEYREENGSFKSRRQLKDVKGLGPKTFTQCAGFLRIRDGENILDNTGVHPESYAIAEKVMERGLEKESLTSQEIKELAEELEVGEPTLKDILEELKKPGRDPREDMPKPVFRTDILSMKDLKIDMIMSGTVRNVVDFGAFVDIGLESDGLVHISEVSDSFVKDINDFLKVGDQVEVKIIDIDLDRERIALSMKGLN